MQASSAQIKTDDLADCVSERLRESTDEKISTNSKGVFVCVDVLRRRAQSQQEISSQKRPKHCGDVLLEVLRVQKVAMRAEGSQVAQAVRQPHSSSFQGAKM
jgi:hypothetical protein